MFKAGQLLQAIILYLSSLLISIWHGLQTDPITQSHLMPVSQPWLDNHGHFSSLTSWPLDTLWRWQIPSLQGTAICPQQSGHLTGYPLLPPQPSPGWKSWNYQDNQEHPLSVLLAPNGHHHYQLHQFMLGLQLQEVPPSQALWSPLIPPNWQIPWDSILMDFIEGLPLSDGHDTILVVVSHLTKMALFILPSEIMMLRTWLASSCHRSSQSTAPW